MGSASQSYTVSLTIPSQAKFLPLVRKVVHGIAEEEGFFGRECAKIMLAVDEACANIIKHCYAGDPSQKIELTLQVQPIGLEIQIRDFGPPVEPEKIRPRPLEQVQPGGLGTHFIFTIMDKVEYSTLPGTGNVVRMIKYRPTTTKGSTEEKQ